MQAITHPLGKAVIWRPVLLLSTALCGGLYYLCL